MPSQDEQLRRPYEELLSRGAEDIKSRAGQYFTPPPLIQAIVDCVLPMPDDTITDPACGTGGFLLAAAEHILSEHGKQLTVRACAPRRRGGAQARWPAGAGQGRRPGLSPA